MTSSTVSDRIGSSIIRETTITSPVPGLSWLLTRLLTRGLIGFRITTRFEIMEWTYGHPPEEPPGVSIEAWTNLIDDEEPPG